MALIHDGFEKEKQFKPQAGYVFPPQFHWLLNLYRVKDEHNQKVKKWIEEEILLDRENTYSRLLIESMRDSVLK